MVGENGHQGNKNWTQGSTSSGPRLPNESTVWGVNTVSQAMVNIAQLQQQTITLMQQQQQQQQQVASMFQQQQDYTALLLRQQQEYAASFLQQRQTPTMFQPQPQPIPEVAPRVHGISGRQNVGRNRHRGNARGNLAVRRPRRGYKRERCHRCNRYHSGRCYWETGGCFCCGSTGHHIANCPIRPSEVVGSHMIERGSSSVVRDTHISDTDTTGMV